MNPTRVLLVASALLLGALGLLGTFLPAEALGWAGTPTTAPLVLLVQVTGALYLGFAALDWMSREHLLGGIYGRPLTVGNLMHFLVAALAMVRVVGGGGAHPVLWALTALYALMAAAYAVVLFRHPLAPVQPPEPSSRSV